MSTSSSPPYHNVGEFYPRKFGPKPDVVPSGVTERKVMPLDKPDMVTVDVLNLGEAGLLCYNANANSQSSDQFSTFPRLQHAFWSYWVPCHMCDSGEGAGALRVFIC